MAGRTHGQHAVPITFGLKVASWIDEIGRHISRMRELEPRLFVAIIGGAAGSFASLGDRAPEVQDGVAKRLRLAAMPVPSRSIVDHFAEFVRVLGLLGATCGKVGREIYILMKTEYGEVEESVPEGTVGSSTMPQKRNPQLCQDILSIAAEIRHAHDVVYQAAQAAASQNLSFPDRLAADHRVTAHLSQSAIDALLDPASLTPPGIRTGTNLVIIRAA